MPLYQYKCRSCQKSFERYSTIACRNEEKICDFCGEYADRDVEGELSNMGEFDATCKEHERWSWSMGINPDDPKQVSAAKARHPGAEFDRLGRMRIGSRNEKLKRMKECGMEEWH